MDDTKIIEALGRVSDAIGRAQEGASQWIERHQIVSLAILSLATAALWVECFRRGLL